MNLDYQWIDEKSDLARIPIDRAIELIAERGLPVNRQTEVEAKVQQDQE